MSLRYDPERIADNDEFWTLVARAHAARPDLQRVLSALAADDLLAFAANVTEARDIIRDASDGPIISDPSGSGPLSEDGTTRLCDWIVSQGRDCWLRHRDATDAQLAPMFAARDDEGGMLRDAAFHVYEAQVGRRRFLQDVETLMETTWARIRAARSSQPLG